MDNQPPIKTFSMKPARHQHLNTMASYIVTMATTIQVSKGLRKTLEKRKMHGKESYEDVIWDLLEDTMELSEETKRDIAKARKDLKAGRVKSLDQIKKELGF